MTRNIKKLVDLLQIARPDMVLAAVSNSWCVVMLSRQLEPAWRQNAALTAMPLGLVLLLTACVAGGLAVYALAINDLLDARQDRVFARHRPLPAGRVAWSSVVVMASLGLLLALFAAVFLGRAPMLLCLLAAVGVLFYNTVGKHLPALGVVTLGLICALNMLIPVPTLGFTWPIWLTMTHVMATAALVHHLRGKRPRLLAEPWWTLWAGWAFWTLALLTTMRYRHALWLHEQPLLWLGPAGAGMVYVLLAWWQVRQHEKSPRTRRTRMGQISRLAVLWLVVYDMGWVLGAGLYWHSLLFLGLLAVAIGLLRGAGWISQWTGPAPTYRVHRTTPSSARLHG